MPPSVSVPVEFHLLTLARLGFQTAIRIKDANPAPLPNPPAALFIRSDYQAPGNNWLPAFITPDPHDGQRHAAIIWLTGGDSNSLGDFWTPGPDSNDQSARAFRDAGMVMYFPTLRGGNGDATGKELFLGEVDDVLAAAAQLAKAEYVDPKRIYLGGHSTGGTLALLVAEMKNPFKAIFAFGPVDQIDRYPPSLFPVQVADYGEREIKLRSPIHWLPGIHNPTYLIEGMSGTSNGAALEAMCKATDNPMVHCVRVHNADHFSVLHKVTQRLAAKILIDNMVALSLTAEEFN
jgi:predicted alpha/beta-hydrolase family hydrolase